MNGADQGRPATSIDSPGATLEWLCGRYSAMSALSHIARASSQNTETGTHRASEYNATCRWVVMVKWRYWRAESQLVFPVCPSFQVQSHEAPP